MKKVAFFSDGWRKYFNYAWIDGSHKYIHDNNLDINLYVFNCFGNFSQDEKFNLGEYNIFNLPDLSDFDGILVDFTNIAIDGVKDSLIAKIKESGLPVVSLVAELEGAHCAGINNYEAMYTIVEHMITEHGCKTLSYVGGPADNGENKERFRAYKDVLTKYGIEVEEERIFHKDFDIASGEESFRHFKEKELLPDVFICACDNLAVGLCYEAKKHGYNVPKDFLVSGFDNFDKASFFSPRITTAGFVREDIAYKAMGMLHRLMEGQEVEDILYADVVHVFQDSCGCIPKNPRSRGEFVEYKIFGEDREVRMTNKMLNVKRTLLECRSFEEMGQILPRHLEDLGCGSIYMLINHEYARGEEYANADYIKGKIHVTDEYPKDMEVVMAYKNGQILSNVSCKEGHLIPEDITENGQVFVFSPIHFRDQEVGYMVFKNSDYMLDGQLIFELLNVLLESLENMYHRILLNRMNEELSMLYVMDSLTGLYNRMAYNRFAIPMYEECMRLGKPLMIMFVDVDRLKYINDTFGHDMGNVAIKTISRAISAHLPEKGIAIRYGGDEFVVMIPEHSKEEAEYLIGQIESHVRRTSFALNTGFEITSSMGYVIADDENVSLADYINIADERMYEKKRAKNAARK